MRVESSVEVLDTPDAESSVKIDKEKGMSAYGIISMFNQDEGEGNEVFQYDDGGCYDRGPCYEDSCDRAPDPDQE